jgi:hypothetical protein
MGANEYVEQPAQSSAYPGSLMDAKGAVSNSKNRARLSSSGSCTDRNESSPRSGLSWYSTDSETGIKISKAIDAITGVSSLRIRHSSLGFY